ncbi:hypothetical protein LTR15_002425 [Elasticomyces elasticus]|nr:hypothetical protein LTR15_002425 [Elasticomyces elasticus]
MLSPKTLTLLLPAFIALTSTLVQADFHFGRRHCPATGSCESPEDGCQPGDPDDYWVAISSSHDTCWDTGGADAGESDDEESPFHFEVCNCEVTLDYGALTYTNTFSDGGTGSGPCFHVGDLNTGAVSTCSNGFSGICSWADYMYCSSDCCN